MLYSNTRTVPGSPPGFVLPASEGAMRSDRLGALTPDRRNARRHTPRNIGMIETSLQTDGFGRSILLDRDGNILAGNGVTEAAGNVGLEDVIVVPSDGTKVIAIQRTDVEPGSARAVRLAIADNRTQELSDFDPAVIAALSEEIDLSDFWQADEMDALLAGITEDVPAGDDPGAEMDRGDELAAEYGVEPNQLWVLGRHRLIVGDCTDDATIDRLMDGQRAAMVFTDPPYGVDYDGGLNETKRDRIIGDTSASLYAACIGTTAPYCNPHAPWYLWFAGTVGKPVYEAVEYYGYTVRAMIVWNKTDAHYGNFMAQYMQKHEPCLYCVKESPQWYGPTNEVTVWDVKQPSVNEHHPTQKPIELAVRAIENSSVRGALVCDWFLGSGTTLIACEQMGRTCYAAEIEPRYAAVSIKRWADMTGLTPRRVD
jgi:DNA modification methylase